MKEYHKIQTVFLRNPDTKFKTLLEGEFSLPEFEYLKDSKWNFTEKVDGTNIRVIFYAGTVFFRGRTDKAQIPEHLLNNLQEQFLPLVPVVNRIFKDGFVCFYGEGYGPKIQKGGGLYRNDPGFVLFDIKFEDRLWLTRPDCEEISNDLGIDIVPIIGTPGTLNTMVDLVKTGFNSSWGDFKAEGLIAKPTVELQNRQGKRIITKLKHSDF